MDRLFGTDGIRGVANSELTCELATKVGQATANALLKRLKKVPRIVIGCDTRMSSDMLVAAVSAGICSFGASAITLGVVSTPAVAYLTRLLNADAGVMISASHNSFEYNGIKIFGNEGFKLSDVLEAEIESTVLGESLKNPLPCSAIGRITNEEDGAELYLSFLKSTASAKFDGLKIAVDCANGSASKTAERLFTTLGARVYMLNNTPNGRNINENCGSTHTDALQKYVVDNKLDCGLAFDGDADRLLCVDEHGGLVDGDMIMAICALDMRKRKKLEKNTVVGTVMSNFGFIKFCAEQGISFTATKVGDKFVLEEMIRGGYSLGGEQSGHIIFREFATTGDGQLTAVQLLSIMAKEGKSLFELASVMTKSPQIIINVAASDKKKLLFSTSAVIREAIFEAEAELGNAGRIIVRPSGTEPLIRVMAEGENQSFIENIAKRISRIIDLQLGER